MTTSMLKSMREEKGFTLVELAVVMIIIGLLIGGILKGQEMIANAQITSTVAQAKALDAATSTFRDQYNAFPGDMANATTRLVGCAAPCANGTGDGRVGLNVGAAAALNNEGAYYFNQLRTADLITGLDGSNTLSFGQALPSASVGGGYMVGHSAVGGTGFTATELRPSHYLVLTGQVVASSTAGSGILTTSQAARIDRKMDDGQANRGSVVSETSAAACRTGGTTYNESDPDQVCNIAIRIQG